MLFTLSINANIIQCNLFAFFTRIKGVQISILALLNYCPMSIILTSIIVGISHENDIALFMVCSS